MTISIIIPTKNEISVIEDTLKRFRTCTRNDYEIIISDGGSTDGTIAVAEKYANAVVVYKGAVRQTIAAGRNAGAREAKGEYLAFFDADMTVHDPDAFFAKALAIFETHPTVVALTCCLRVLPGHETAADRLFFSLINWVYFLENNILRIGAASGEFQMVRRSVFEKVGGYREDLVVAEDQELFRRLARAGRTHFARYLTLYHTGRRAHKIGWPKLLLLWTVNGVSVPLFGRSFQKVWKEIR